jgi:hypothetical protein
MKSSAPWEFSFAISPKSPAIHMARIRCFNSAKPSGKVAMIASFMKNDVEKVYGKDVMEARASSLVQQ